MFLFVKAKKRVLSLTMAFMLCIGFCPSIRSNEIASYTSQVIQHLVSPTNVAALLMGLFMMAAMLYTFKKSDLHDHSVGFAPVKKNDILVDRSSYVGKIPEDIDTMLIHIQSGDFKKNRIQDDKPVVGILLYAPSGAGKTFLSQLIAKEANCPVFMVSLSNFQQGQIVGSGSKSVMNLFEKAKEQALKWNSKTAIICIDELHNFQQGGSSGYRDPSKEVTDALLTEMDGKFTSEKYKDE